MKTSIRRANIEDLPFLLKLEKESFPIFQQNSIRTLKHGINSHFQEFLIDISFNAVINAVIT
jgi:hypothetical protein